MVIQHTNDKTGNKMIFPAERCSWDQVEDADSVSINNVWFQNSGKPRIYLSNENGSVLLGHIGKSGRFVAISN